LQREVEFDEVEVDACPKNLSIKPFGLSFFSQNYEFC
jgi:hypothetical protein